MERWDADYFSVPFFSGFFFEIYNNTKKTGIIHQKLYTR